MISFSSPGNIQTAGNAVCITMGSGCPRSKADLARLFPYFQLNGWRLTERVEDADLVVVNTCGFNDKAEAECVSVVRAARRRAKPSARLIVTGCLASINPATLQSAGADAPIPPLEMHRFDDLVGGHTPLSAVGEVNDFEPLIRQAERQFPPMQRTDWKSRLTDPKAVLNRALRPWRRRRYRNVDPSVRQRTFHLRIARGCLGECTFCAIRAAEGTLVSRQIEPIIEEFRTGLSRSFKHFDMLAGDVGAYGRDIGTTLPALLTAILAHDGDYVLDLPDLHPRWLLEYRRELIDLLARNERRFGFLLLPIESGSDRILDAMKRRHRIEPALDAMIELHAAAPAIRLQTQAIVGFPGETQADFAATLRALSMVPFSRITAWTFSQRPNTEAALMADKVPPEVAASRLATVRRKFRHRFKW